jgi:hypothetical protein
MMSGERRCGMLEVNAVELSTHAEVVGGMSC